ncbi:MAG: APC family permease [Planctomycetaceae bacterium]
MAQPSPPADNATPSLRRTVGVGGAVMLGLGSMIGTGVFVSIGIAAGLAGPAVTVAIILAAAVAACNALSSAQLAACHPVSGGTYEYGYRRLSPALGFAAGWMFLAAKTASAATAALGFAAYALHAFGREAPEAALPVALAAVGALTVLVLTGLRRSNQVNVVIVSITLATLTFFVLAGLPPALSAGRTHLRPFFPSDVLSLLEATALMFVAYTGYGRVATLGEEIDEPRRNIPVAVVVTVSVTMIVYVAVGLVGVSVVGAERFAAVVEEGGAPLEAVAATYPVPGARWVLAAGAVTAMFGVLLNLILGLSRVALAMGRRGDLPAVFGRLNRQGTTPVAAVAACGVLIALLAVAGDVKTTWSFSAFTVLIYYALTNLAALRLTSVERLYPRWISWLGLLGCLSLAFWVEWRIWLSGLALLAAGLAWHAARRALGHIKQ